MTNTMVSEIYIYICLQKIDRQMDWEEAKKERVKICLTKEYTSSDESGVTIKRLVLGRQKVKGSQGFDRPVLDGTVAHNCHIKTICS